MGVGYYLDKKPVVDRSKLMAFIKGGKQVQQKQKQKQKVRGEQRAKPVPQSSYNPTIFLQSSYKPVLQSSVARFLSLPGLGCVSPSAPGGGRSRRKRASRCAMAKWAAGDEIQDTEGRVGRKA